MPVDRNWGWNLDEMKTAAAMGSDQVPQMHEQYQVVGGFTPINPPESFPAVSVQLGEIGNTNDSRTGEKASVSKKRKTPASTKATTAKSRKTASAKKPKKRKTASELQCQDISEGLSRTKPAVSGNDVFSHKGTTPTTPGVLEDKIDAGSPPKTVENHETGNSDENADVRLAFSGLAARYQSERSVTKENSIDPRVLSKRSFVPGDSGRSNAREEDDNFAELPGNEPWNGVKRGIHNLPWKADNSALLNLTIPPSAQGECEESVGNLGQTCQGLSRTRPQKYFDSDEIFGDQDDRDEFPVDDEGLEEIMQSVVSPEQQRDCDVDWRREDFVDEALLSEDWNNDHEQQAKISSHWRRTSVEEIPIISRSEEVVSHLQSPDPSRFLARNSGNAIQSGPRDKNVPEDDEDCFNDDDLDEDLVDLTADGSDFIQPQTPPTSLQRPPTPKLQWMPPKMYTPVKSSQIPLSPIDTPHIVPVNKDGEALPFTRPPFPKPIRDRSPILGLSSRIVLRTCFRIGEALNAAKLASRSSTDAMIELYARIMLSERETDGGFKQFLQFGDLFTHKPPYLSGTYSLWKGVELWDVDSRVFIGTMGKGKMARVVGRIKKREQGGCEMVVLSIWEVDWEDVGVAKGIVCS